MKVLDLHDCVCVYVYSLRIVTRYVDVYLCKRSYIYYKNDNNNNNNDKKFCLCFFLVNEGKKKRKSSRSVEIFFFPIRY